MTQARDLMTSHVVFVDPDDRVERAIELMLRHRVSGLPVVNSANELLGVITEYDIIDMVDDLETERNQVYHYMSRSPVTIEADTPVSELGKMFRSRSIRRFPVVENVPTLKHDRNSPPQPLRNEGKITSASHISRRALAHGFPEVTGR
jgi:CBS domain-containing protein